MVKMRRHLQLLLLAALIGWVFCNANSHVNYGFRALSFYVHIVSVPYENQTVSAFPLVGMPPPQSSNLPVGYSVAYDNKMTAAQDYYSQEIGRSRGYLVTTSESGEFITETLTLSFYEYDGYIECGWRNDLSQQHNEFLVVGGSGYFSNIRGTFKVERVEQYGTNLANYVLHGEVHYRQN